MYQTYYAELTIERSIIAPAKNSRLAHKLCERNKTTPPNSSCSCTPGATIALAGLSAGEHSMWQACTLVVAPLPHTPI